MSGIVGNGFMGRFKGDVCVPSFLPNYIADDISGCVMAFGNMRYFSGYAGDCTRLEAEDIGFCGDFLDSFEISEKLGSGNHRLSTWYNQLTAGNNATTTLNNSIRYNATNKLIVENFATPALGFLTFPAYTEIENFAYTQPFTVISVYDLVNQNTTTARSWWFFSGGSTNVIQLYNQAGGLLSVDIRAGSGRLLRRWGQVMQTGIQLCAFVYDGSNTIGGMNFYYNEMTAPLAGTTIVNTPLTTFPNYSGGQNVTTTVNGYVNEFIVFNKALTTSELQDVKSWLENKYTFPV